MVWNPPSAGLTPDLDRNRVSEWRRGDVRSDCRGGAGARRIRFFGERSRTDRARQSRGGHPGIAAGDAGARPGEWGSPRQYGKHGSCTSRSRLSAVSGSPARAARSCRKESPAMVRRPTGKGRGRSRRRCRHAAARVSTARAPGPQRERPPDHRCASAVHGTGLGAAEEGAQETPPFTVRRHGTGGSQTTNRKTQ